MNDENLKNGLPYQFKSGEEAASAGAKGGRKSGETRRRKRDAKKAAQYILDLTPQLSENVSRTLLAMGLDPKSQEDATIQTIMLAALAAKAMKGDVKAIALLMEITGQDVDTRIAKAKLSFERQKLKAMSNKDAPMDDINAQINSIAALIREPQPDRDLPD